MPHFLSAHVRKEIGEVEVENEGELPPFHLTPQSAEYWNAFVSSLGAPVGTSDYHVSKQKAEAATRRFAGSWSIARLGNVYGPGDEQISVLLRMVRGPTSIVPKVGEGDQPFQPIWWVSSPGWG